MNNQLLLNTFLQTLSPIVAVVLEIGIILLVAVLIQFFKKYLKKMGIIINNDELKIIEDVIKKAVITINQKVVDDIKDASPNGKLTEDQQKEVYQMAYDIIKRSLSEDQLGLIKKIYGDEETGIEVLIENMVVDVKQYKLPSIITYDTSNDETQSSENVDKK